MSMTEDFKNAPVGATATHPDGIRVVMRGGDETDGFPWVCTTYGELFCNEELADGGYTLVPSAPTTSREALDLAWNLAHPLKEGQVMPKGTRAIDRKDGMIVEYVARGDWTPRDHENIRTLDPLLDPEPDWLDAPAVLAAMNECYSQKVWLPMDNGRWECTCCGAERHWSKMTNVTPLYPKEGQNA